MVHWQEPVCDRKVGVEFLVALLMETAIGCKEDQVSAILDRK